MPSIISLRDFFLLVFSHFSDLSLGSVKRVFTVFRPISTWGERERALLMQVSCNSIGLTLGLRYSILVRVRRNYNATLLSITWQNVWRGSVETGKSVLSYANPLICEINWYKLQLLLTRKLPCEWKNFQSYRSVWNFNQEKWKIKGWKRTCWSFAFLLFVFHNSFAAYCFAPFVRSTCHVICQQMMYGRVIKSAHSAMVLSN